MLLERRFSELIQKGRTIEGTALRYGEVATGAPFPERFEAGAFQPLGDIPFTVQHDRRRIIARNGGGGLELQDTTESLKIRAKLLETREAQDAHLMISNGLLRGLSIEFYPTSESQENGVRVLSKAVLTTISAVDDPAYDGSHIEARQLRGSFLRARVPWNTRLGCECHRGNCKRVKFSEGAFDETLDDEENEVLAIIGNYQGAIASRKRGSLVLKSTSRGLEIDLKDTANTDAARMLAEQAREVPIFARPVFAEPSEFVETGTGENAIATYKKARLRAILLGPTDVSEGWTPIEIGLPPPRRRHRKVGRLWL